MTSIRGVDRAAQEFGEGYKAYITSCKTEWEAASYVTDALRKQGFISVEELRKTGKTAGPGAKVYAVNRDRSVCAAVLGSRPVEDGARVVAAHIDSPLLFLRPSPFFEKCGFALASTYSRGGIKTYQWPQIPLALHGKLVLKDGSVKELVYGECAEEPAFYIDDLAAHLSAEQRKKPLGEAVTGSQLSVILASQQEGEGENYLEELLQQHLGVSREDFQYGEIYAVPALPARDVGLDRAHIAAYGQDDRICAYAALEALLSADVSGKTAVAMFQDREEIGSLGNTAAASCFYADFLTDLLELSTGESNRAAASALLSHTQVINGDVTFLREPMDDTLMEPQNNSISGGGTSVACYMSNTLPQYRSRFMRMLDRHQVLWQLSTEHSDRVQFGSSVAQSFHRENMDTVSAGPGLNGMHGVYELVHKTDLYHTYLAYRAFYEDIEL